MNFISYFHRIEKQIIKNNFIKKMLIFKKSKKKKTDIKHDEMYINTNAI